VGRYEMVQRQQPCHVHTFMHTTVDQYGEAGRQTVTAADQQAGAALSSALYPPIAIARWMLDALCSGFVTLRNRKMPCTCPRTRSLSFSCVINVLCNGAQRPGNSEAVLQLQDMILSFSPFPLLAPRFPFCCSYIIVLWSHFCHH
jgi:hypothetical protein